MTRLPSGLMATAIAASFAVVVPMPADSAPVYVPKSDQVRTEQAVPEVEKVHSRRYYRNWRRGQRRYWRDRYYYGDPYYRRDSYYRSYYGPRPYRYYRRPGVTLYFEF